MNLVSQSDDANYIDIGYGKPVRLSSCQDGWAAPDYLLPARLPGTAAFHTALEENPWLIIDLEDTCPVKRIRVFNEDGLPGRAIPLLIEVSDDGERWRDITTVHFIFGGRSAKCPLDLVFRERERCRYIRITALKLTFLHLEYVEVMARPPDCELGRLANLRVRRPRILAEYHHHDSHGFAWTFTCALSFIINCREAGIEVDRVDFSRCMVAFKDRLTDDPYPLLFAPPSARERLDGLPHAGFQHHGVYAGFDLPLLKHFVDVYFAPSPTVLAFEAGIVARYGIVAERTLAIVYRGTDKNLEVRPTPIERYIDAALSILHNEPDLRVVIQTDQLQALQAVKAALPQAVHFEEMPVTAGATVIHGLELERDFAVSRAAFAIRMLAITHLLARMRYVISHTGNIGLWLALYRGDNAGFFQFDVDTNLRDPSGRTIAPRDAGAATVDAATVDAANVDAANVDAANVDADRRPATGGMQDHSDGDP